MKTYTLNRDGDRNVRFTGEKLAAVTSKDYNSNRWTEIDIYRTAKGKLVAHIVYRTQWQGENDRSSVVICDSEDTLVESLRDDYCGQLDWVAKEALAAAGIECVEEID